MLLALISSCHIRNLIAETHHTRIVCIGLVADGEEHTIWNVSWFEHIDPASHGLEFGLDHFGDVQLVLECSDKIWG